MRRIKQIGGIPKAGLEAVVCAAKVNQQSSDEWSLLEFSGLFLESISVSECYFHISKSFFFFFLIFNPSMFFAISNFSSISPFCLMLVSAL